MNYIVNREQTLLLQKEIAELKSENTILKRVVRDYQEGLISASTEFQEKSILEEKQQKMPRNQRSKKEKTGIPFWKLSNSESQVLSILFAEKGKTISREDLSIRIWGTTASNSSMARLSTIIKKLRSKLEIYQGKQEIIRTNWGKGYQLTNAFFEYYEIDDQFLKEYEIAQ